MHPGSTLRTWSAFLLGDATAIRAIASHSRAWAFGLALVGLTAVARNHDQTWLGEAPAKWLFGNLAFSIASGTLLFVIVRAGLHRTDPGTARPRLGLAWIQFLGLFWATAPVAWLYAIPVERLLGSLDAARANVALLGTVSLWRVLLMARVISVVRGVPWWGALGWTLVAACVETAAVCILGGTLAKSIMAGMGGLRNSPEEEVLLRAMGTAFSGAVILFIPALLAGMAARLNGRGFRPEPSPVAGPLPWRPLGIAALVWLAVAVPAQIEVRRNAELDAHMAAGRYRDVLEHMIRHGSDAYAPSRILPPRVHEARVVEELGDLFNVLRPDDPAWIHQHLISKLGGVGHHFDYTPSTGQPHPMIQRETLPWRSHRALDRLAQPHAWIAILDGLERSDAGRLWLSENTALFWLVDEEIQSRAESPGPSKPTPGAAVDAMELANRLLPYPQPPRPERKDADPPKP